MSAVWYEMALLLDFIIISDDNTSTLWCEVTIAEMKIICLLFAWFIASLFDPLE